jgi:voltage-gated potassium channel
MNFTKIYLIWNIISMLATMAITIQLLLAAAFGELISVVLFWVCTAILFADIPLSFNQTFIATSQFRLPREGSANNYLKKWLIIDLIGAIPFGILLGSPIVGLVRLIKLIRTYEIMKTIAKKSILFSINYYWLLVLYWYILLIHALACGRIWVTGIRFGDKQYQYMEALYWVTSHITWMGNGSISAPGNILDYAYTVFVQLTGVLMIAYIIATVIYYYRRKDPTTQTYFQNMKKVLALTRFRGLPVQTRTKLLDYYSYQWRNRLGFNEADSLEGIPPSLQKEVALHLKRDVLEHVDMFNEAGEHVMNEIAAKMEPVTLMPDEMLFQKGDMGDAMYFVVTGKLNAIDPNHGNILGSFGVGDFFGEIALFEKRPRTATIIAEVYSDLYCLNQRAVDRLRDLQIDIYEGLRQKAIEREAENIRASTRLKS